MNIVVSEKSALALCSFHAYPPSAPNPLLLYYKLLDRQVIAECNHYKNICYNFYSLLTINILQKVV